MARENNDVLNNNDNDMNGNNSDDISSDDGSNKNSKSKSKCKCKSKCKSKCRKCRRCRKYRKCKKYGNKNESKNLQKCVCFVNRKMNLEDCDACYRTNNNCGGNQLNVKASCCIYKNENYLDLFQKLVTIISVNNLEVLLYNVVDDVSYAIFYDTILNNLPVGYRIVVADPSGHVVVDTSMGANINTFHNYNVSTIRVATHAFPPHFVELPVSGLINENHNTRVAIMEAQMFAEGTGYETKFSDTTKTVQAYVAIRLGQFRNSSGTIRLSKNIVNDVTC